MNRLYHGVIDPNGFQVGNVGDAYNQIADGVFVKKWLKITGNGTNTGWV